MPALDPLSAASRPMLPFDQLPSRPLAFADTLRPIDINAALPYSNSSHKLPRPKRYKDTLPTTFPAPPYTHSRNGNYIPVGEGLGAELSARQDEETYVIGSDEWMRREVARCVDAATGTLQIRGLGLTTLSTKISDLRNLVTLPASFSPRKSTSSARPAPSSPVPLPDTSPCLSPAKYLSANARPFSRISSAPAISAFYSDSKTPRSPSDRYPNGLDKGKPLFGQLTVSEVNEDASAVDQKTPSDRSGLRMEGSRIPSPEFGISLLVDRQASWGRSKTGAANRHGEAAGSGRTKDVCILAGQNLLTTLPSALFEISNLTVLSLRGNKLSKLPPAIGELCNLKELNISNNEIVELPHTILSLPLVQFHVHPNRFLPLPRFATPGSVPLTFSERKLSSIIRHESNLGSLCLRVLISPRPPSDLPPLLDAYAWDPPIKGEPHALLDIPGLREIIPGVSTEDLGRVLQALRSASFHYTHVKPHERRGISASIMGVAGHRTRQDPLPRSHSSALSDDASTNPWFCPCPSPNHLEYEASSNVAGRPSRHLFLKSAEERIEWREVFGQADLPVRWLGCSPGCLAFLEQEEAENWGVDGEDL